MASVPLWSQSQSLYGPLLAMPGSPRPGHHSLLHGDGPDGDPGVIKDLEVPFLCPPPLVGPLQHLPLAHPIPAPQIPGPGSHGPAWLPGPVIHPKPVPVPAGPDSPHGFPRDHLGPLTSQPCPPVIPGPDGAAGSQFLPRELVWAFVGWGRGHPAPVGASPSPWRGAVSASGLSANRAGDGDDVWGPPRPRSPKHPLGALGPQIPSCCPGGGCSLQPCSLSPPWVRLGTSGTVPGLCPGSSRGVGVPVGMSVPAGAAGWKRARAAML